MPRRFILSLILTATTALHAQTDPVAAGIPHWVKLAPGTTTTYFVFKEK